MSPASIGTPTMARDAGSSRPFCPYPAHLCVHNPVGAAGDGESSEVNPGARLEQSSHSLPEREHTHGADG